MSEQNIKEKNSALEWIKPILIAIGIVLIIRMFLFEPYLVRGESMNSTLEDGERLFVNKTVKFIGEIEKGDIIIIDGENERYVKRVLGLPGDILQAKNGILFINKKEVNEPYLKENEKKAAEAGQLLTDDFGPVEVPENEIFVMGDNRTNSLDSRNGLGLINKKRIIGKSEFVFFPFNEVGKTE
ncbi:signal peptidase I [Metabacillus fastidiosus]|uniref:signal peptidase I n=1 Tax=Metabacillus fastidiosus TaxID=1458 RepID=UPI003D278BD9